MPFGHVGDDAGGWHCIPGRGWVWFPPFTPNLGNTATPGTIPGVGGAVGDPRIDGGWRPWERLTLEYLNALRTSLDSDSPEAFAEAIRTPEHSETLAQLHKASCGALEADLASLQEQLHEPGANKAAIVKQIRAVLLQMSRNGCGS